MNISKITVYNRKDFRDWLKKNHKKENKMAVIVHKRHTGKPAPTHRELLEEAICFGWIDTIINRIDEDTFIRNFSKRNDKSRWSDNTLRYAQQLIKDGKMTAQGLYYYKLGLSRPTHDHGIPKNPDMPLDLKLALSKNKKAKENFKKFSPSTKRTIYRWLLSAKLNKTKRERIDKIIRSASAGNKDLFTSSEKSNI